MNIWQSAPPFPAHELPDGALRVEIGSYIVDLNPGEIPPTLEQIAQHLAPQPAPAASKSEILQRIAALEAEVSALQE